MEVRAGYKRSYSVVIRKMLNEVILSGYPRVYPTAIDVANGYFILGNVQIPIMTTEQLQNLTQSEYNARIALLKDYVIQQEGMNPFDNQFNENVVYDPDSCVPEIITTTTTTEAITTTTTTAPVTTTTTTEELLTTTTTEEVTTTTTTAIPYANSKYGLMYNWYVVDDARKITSSDDWVVSYRADFSTLQTYLGGYAVAGGKLKETGTTHWDSPNTDATNEVSFNARGAGIRTGNLGNFGGLKTEVYFMNYDYSGFCSYIAYNSGQFNLITSTTNNINAGVSIRLIYVGAGTPTAYVGNDLKTYNVVLIGSQYWLSENLQETQFRNGDYLHGFEGGVYTPISNANWAALTSEGVCCQEDDTNNI